MNIEQRIIEKLCHIEEEMKSKALWRELPPSPEAFESTEPFSIDTMEAIEWLQWVLIPRLYAIIEQGAVLPSAFAIAPYFEEAYKHDEEEQYQLLLMHLRELDSFFNSQSGR
ncbi:YqcC family protein [Providencia vermicola]|uniref:YqcC family protein n=2 Tax=Providencia TaxID=586 RepID=A0ABD5L0Z6_PROST|nr:MULTISPECIES: YqcC family protein [Providencia]ELR5044169.1 YqcC family protein [Providencia rettgeri]ELR5120890.1 YqcC family protein [Providencia stuartii]ELR5142487.1 YqcC family protein [Providencia stuartii]ELR5291261.1 YqcC family protein [Providencia stuartii]ELX8380907.1 YqcC family protein [Providencia stuartii]